MKRSTAISRLGDVADGLERAKHWNGAPVTAGYVVGALTDGAQEIERVELAFVVDEPAAVVPWMSRPAHLEALARLLRFDKLPLMWWWRPEEWPVWNHRIGRSVAFWNADDGPDEHVFDALLAGTVSRLRFVEPGSPMARRDQVELERVVARRHLAEVTRVYFDREWRRQHTGDGSFPEDALWAAAAAYVELDDWLSTALS